MGDTKNIPAPVPARPVAAGPASARSWSAQDGAPDRHGAISRQLFSYSHYKSWADKMRTTWKKDDESTAAPQPPPSR